MAQELVDAKVQAVISHVQSPHTQAAIPIYASGHLPHLFTSSNKRLTTLGAGNTFRLVADDQVQAQALASFSVDSLQANKIAAVVEASEFGRDLFADTSDALTRHKKEVALELEVDRTQPVGDDVVARIKAAHPDVILVLGREGHGLSLMEKLKATGFTDVTMVTVNGAKTSKVGAAQIPVRALYATTSTVEPNELPAGAAFLTRFQARDKNPPVWGAHYAHDAVYMLADVMRRAGTTDGTTLIERPKKIKPNTRVNFQMRLTASGEQAYPRPSASTRPSGASGCRRCDRPTGGVRAPARCSMRAFTALTSSRLSRSCGSGVQQDPSRTFTKEFAPPLGLVSARSRTAHRRT